MPLEASKLRIVRQAPNFLGNQSSHSSMSPRTLQPNMQDERQGPESAGALYKNSKGL
jgi:hypothetical protein